MPAVEDEALIALDKQTGREVWRVATSGNVPQHAAAHGARQLERAGLSSGRSRTRTADRSRAAWRPSIRGPASKLWRVHSLDSYLNPSPIAHERRDLCHGLLSEPGGGHSRRRSGRCHATRISLWDIKHGSEVGTPVFYEGHLYWANEESGIVYCVNAARRRRGLQGAAGTAAGRIYASGVIADGKLYYVSRENGTYRAGRRAALRAAGAQHDRDGRQRLQCHAGHQPRAVAAAERQVPLLHG